MGEPNLVSLISLAAGFALGAFATRGGYKSIARWLKEIIPGDQLEPLIGQALIAIGTELKNGSLSVKDAKTKLQSLFRLPL